MLMYQQGVIANLDATGVYTLTDCDDEEWLAISLTNEEDNVDRMTCSNIAFWQLWQEHLPHIKIQPRCDDTWNEYHSIGNKFQFCQNQNQAIFRLPVHEEMENVILEAARHGESARNIHQTIDKCVEDTKMGYE